MPDYSKLRTMESHRVVLEYDTGARIVGYLSACRPDAPAPVQLVRISRAELIDAEGRVMERHDTLSVCPNVLAGFQIEEGPSGRDL